MPRKPNRLLKILDVSRRLTVMDARDILVIMQKTSLELEAEKHAYESLYREVLRQTPEDNSRLQRLRDAINELDGQLKEVTVP